MMKIIKSAMKDLYYTKDYEWINYQGATAYVGVCTFKLIGFKAIEEINFSDPSGFKKKGDLIATIKYKDYTIAVNMPVDGKVLSTNPELNKGHLNVLLQLQEGEAWLVLISPSFHSEKKDLLLPKQYQLKSKSILEKS